MRKGGTLIIQPFPGIGDMIWYLPYLKAIAREEGPITLLTKPRSLAREFLLVDPAFRDVLYADRRLLSMIIPELIRRRFQKSWILHWSVSYASLPFFARVPERVGFGYGRQKYFLTSQKNLPEPSRTAHPITQLEMVMELAGYSIKKEDQIPPLCPKAHKKIIENFSHFPRPWIYLGIGGSVDFKRWPLGHFAELGAEISACRQGTLFICGSIAEEEEALNLQKMIFQRGGAAEVVTRLSIQEAFAFMKEGDLYIGNDTSLLNIAGSFGTSAIGLFGTTPPLTYVPAIHPVLSPNPVLKGKEAMTAISPQSVLSYLRQNQLVGFI